MDGAWRAEAELDEVMNPLHDVPEFDASFMRLIRPATRKSRRERLNLPEEVPTPPSSSSDEDIFAARKQKKRRKITKKSRR